MIRKVKKNNPDTRSVDIDDAYSLEFWTREFGVSVHKIESSRAGSRFGGTECAAGIKQTQYHEN